jgi:hypothetical protein
MIAAAPRWPPWWVLTSISLLTTIRSEIEIPRLAWTRLISDGRESSPSSGRETGIRLAGGLDQFQ